MKITLRLTLALTFLISLFVNAQDLEYIKYNWDEKIDVSKFKLTDDPVVSYKEFYQKEYFVEKNYFYEVSLVHQLIWLNSDDAIEEYNKVYLPFNDSSNLLISKARVVKLDGTIIELSKDKILTAQNEETKSKYKYYAMEGIEKGCFVEFIYAIKSFANYKGVSLVLQSSMPKKDVSFELIAPDNLIFEFMSEGLPEVKKQEGIENKNIWALKNVDINPLVNEAMAPYKSLLKSVVYKLDKNLYNSGNGISSYDLFSQGVFDVMYGELDKKDKKVIEKIVKDLKLSKLNKENKIRAIENYLKKNLLLLKQEGIRNFREIVDSKNANETELTKLFIQICEAADIKSELVFTTNRYVSKFHKTFESINYLDAILLYFPEVNKYTTPVKTADRLGYPFYNYMANYGLFIKKVTVGDFTTALAKIKYIEPLKAKDSKAEMDIMVKFSKGFETTQINLSRSFYGFKAAYYQPYISYLPADKRKKVVEDNLKMYGEDVEIINYTMDNIEPEMFGVLPLVIKGDLTYDGLITKAGDKFIFNLGALIGPQMELYQESDRVLPMDTSFNKFYDRNIEIEIPNGYEVKGLEKINYAVYFDENKKNMDGFVSSYKKEGNKIVIDILEYYNQIRINADQYKKYTKVINAAADFNKIKLVFVKK